MTENAIRFEAHICRERRSYLVTFSTDEQAAAFILSRYSTHVVRPETEADAELVMDTWPVTADLLWPTCEHGLSGSLCSGPNHFGEPTDEWAN